MDQILARLNACSQLSLHKLVQEDDGPLRLTVEIYEAAKVIETYELRWEDYVAYTVTHDNYTPEDNAIRGNEIGYFRGGPSDFMDFIQQSKSQLFDIDDRLLTSWILTTFTRYVNVVSYSPVDVILVECR